MLVGNQHSNRTPFLLGVWTRNTPPTPGILLSLTNTPTLLFVPFLSSPLFSPFLLLLFSSPWTGVLLTLTAPQQLHTMVVSL